MQSSHGYLCAGQWKFCIGNAALYKLQSQVPVRPLQFSLAKMNVPAGVPHAWIFRQLCDSLPDMAEQVRRWRTIWTHGREVAPG